MEIIYPHDNTDTNKLINKIINGVKDRKKFTFTMFKITSKCYTHLSVFNSFDWMQAQYDDLLLKNTVYRGK
jgi:hypothetical protein